MLCGRVKMAWQGLKNLELLITGLIPEWLNLEPPKFITDTH